MEEKRYNFANKIIPLIQSGNEIIFIDEANINL